MAAKPTPNKTALMVRTSPADADAVRLIASRESESISTVLRRLVRIGLAAERRSTSGEAA